MGSEIPERRDKGGNGARLNEREILVYHYSAKRNAWYDATRIVEKIEEDEKAWKVKFSSQRQSVHVSYRNLCVFGSPEKVEFAKVYFRGSPCYKAKEVLCFDGKIYKIFYESGYTCVALPSEIAFVKNALKEGGLASGVMSYYRRVVQETAKTEEDRFLVREFDKIDCVDEKSVLALYLNGQLQKTKPLRGHPLVFPFGANASQWKAIEMMFSNRISVVEGPPGTGKTQTILTFIANAVIHGKTVAVASNNNSATDNVYEKLKKYGYSFFAASLGNAENVERFFKDHHPNPPSFETEERDYSSLERLSSVLRVCFLLENKMKEAEQRLDEIRLEYRHFRDEHPFAPDSKTFSRVKDSQSDALAKTMVWLREKTRIPVFWKKWRIRWRFRIWGRQLRRPLSEIECILEHCYYRAKIRETAEEISAIAKKLIRASFASRKDEFFDLSKAYFEKELAAMFRNRKRNPYDKDNYLLDFKDNFLEEYPVILSSTYSLAKCCPKGFLFDYLIVDESSQVNMASAILAMKMAKNIVIVGDARQLPQIDDADFAKRNRELLRAFKVSNAYSYYGNSILSSVLALYGEDLPSTMLTEHYRCDPEIIAFCNQRFYGDRLIVHTPRKKEGFPMEVIKTVPGNFARKNPDGSGLYNLREADEIVKLVEKGGAQDIGVISPYRRQAECISERLGPKVEASTIHKFQGREKKTIIFTSVINEANDFVDNENLINVAVSRAVERFVLVTSDKVASAKSGVLADLVNYIRYHGNENSMKEGTVRSIYDLLYADYEKQLAAFRAKRPSSDYDSENLTKSLLEKILDKAKYASFGFRMHVPLRQVIRLEKASLEEGERRFCEHPRAHVDFLVFNKMGREPLLAIEVDGVSFHEQSKTQRARDAKKDAILQKAGIPLLRLKTNESGEKERIEDALDAI